ncbi:MAG: hypothetical protein NZ521_10960, partial [Flammeovirgaceae bacterium]|nr:hypothetical protein [Flammeovirgaceae bacterium]MDW8286893.1 hypothetical protein [Flammeovirgaceae bacterium]
TEHASLYRLLLHKKYPLDVAIEKVVFQHSYYYRVEDTAIVFAPFPDEMVACWHETGISELFVNRAVLPEKELPSRLKNIRLNIWQ